jgi:hypothetical protein
MRFALYKGQTLHAVVDSGPGEMLPTLYAETLRALNGADRCIPIVDATHETALVTKAQNAEDARATVRGKSAATMTLPELRKLVFVLAEMAGIEVEP